MVSCVPGGADGMDYIFSRKGSCRGNNCFAHFASSLFISYFDTVVQDGFTACFMDRPVHTTAPSKEVFAALTMASA